MRVAIITLNLKTTGVISLHALDVAGNVVRETRPTGTGVVL